MMLWKESFGDSRVDCSRVKVLDTMIKGHVATVVFVCMCVHLSALLLF